MIGHTKRFIFAYVNQRYMKSLLLFLFVIVINFVFSQESAFNESTSYNNVYGIVIGIADYQGPPKLKYSDDDARLMYEVINQIFPENEVDTLINENATQYSIYKKLINVTEKAKDGDLVVFYFSGHGDVAGNIVQGKKGYFLAYDANNSREYYAGGAVEFDDVKRALEVITNKEANVWMITDACKSGAINSKLDTLATMTALNATMDSYTKATKFISCSSEQQSFEYDALNQGVFTYYLVKALSGEADTEVDPGKLSAKEINTYIDEKVYTFTNSRQSPSVTSGNIRKNILNTNEEFAALLKDVDEKKLLKEIKKGVTIKGSGESTPDSENIQKFKKLIRQEQLYGSTGFALEVYQNNSFNTNEAELDEMKSLLVEALLRRGQESINIFLSDRPDLSTNNEYQRAAEDFNYVATILGDNHPLSNQILAKSKFCKALHLSQSRNDISKSIAMLKDLKKENPDAAYINQGLAIVYIQNYDKENAKAELAEAQHKISTWSKPLNSLAYLDIIQGKLNDASSKIKESEELSGNTENSELVKAYLFSANFELHKVDEAIKSIKNQKGEITDAEIAALEGSLNELRGRVKYAQELYLKSIAGNENNVSTLNKLAGIYYQDHDTSNAINYYSKVLRLDPENQSAKAAIAALKNQSVVIDNTKVNLRNHNEVINVCQTLERSKKYQEAINLLEKTNEIADWDPAIYYELAKHQYNIGNEQKSIESLKKALELSPYHFNSIRSLVYIHLGKKQYSEAAAIIKKYEKNFDESAKYLSLSYQVYQYTGNRRDLYSILEKAVQLDSLETEAYKGLYHFHLEEGNFKEAKFEFENLMAIGGGYQDSVDFYNTLDAQVRKQVNLRYYEGLDEGLAILLKDNEYDFELSFFMALTLYMKMDYEGANKQLRKFSSDIQSFTPAVQVEFYKLKAKIQLETGHPELAERLFSMGATQMTPPSYLGLAMAQYDQKKSNWVNYYGKAQNMDEDWNADALARIEKMKKKAGGKSPQGGAERTRRY